MVREELLRDLLPALELRSWLCRLASGTGGGTFFCGRAGPVSAMLVVSPSLESASDAVSSEASCETMCAGADVGMGGVGGSGLFRSEFVLLCVLSSGVSSATAKSSNGTVSGVRSFTSLPWRCLGAGGGFLFSFFGASPRTSPACSSSEAAIS